ncbi:MAG: formylglycine-generating enzyme family protein [Halobacteriovoraceae bacterium]|nr:formylglycine-generating enzyme family protein [Halobacteriovoraceae bacterium]
MNLKDSFKNRKKIIIPTVLILLTMGILGIDYNSLKTSSRHPAQTNDRCGIFCSIGRVIIGLFDRDRYEQTAEFAPAIPKLSFILIEVPDPDEFFLMGSSEGEAHYRKNEKGVDGKQVEVTFKKNFEIMATEVTQRQWFEVMGDNPSRFKNPEDCKNHEYLNGLLEDGSVEKVGVCVSHPVERVSWYMVRNFIKELNRLSGNRGCEGRPQDPTGCFRLPTEAEWEFAARGGTVSAYSFEDPDQIADYAWYRENSNKQTHPVGSLASNPYGLFDMHGNVWEWTRDSWRDFLEGGVDPLHTDSESGRVTRGGSWGEDASDLRSANRQYGHSTNGDYYVGFRLVRTL